MKSAICITGCTATGKSKIANEIAEIRPSVIINADSIQVYQCMRVLSSRPSDDDFQNCENRLYGHIECGVDYSVGKWLQEVEIAIKYAHSRKKTPIIVGGTGLYFSALFKGLSFIPPVSKETKKKSQQLRKNSPEVFLIDLKANDNETYKNIDKQNVVRVQRAWEVFTDTGYGLSYWQEKQNSPFLRNHECKRFIISCDKSILEDNISNRSHKMFEQGVELEVKSILNSNFLSNAAHPAHKAIGFSAVSEYIQGKLGLEEAISVINVKTRQYAKRQRTWFRNQMHDWEILELTTKAGLGEAAKLIDSK
ncbi:MAG: tRNA (adenosine(37)-N6)-dimethylallyltransferase MiaA [Rhodobacteraceae bacterium]|nr:MAG: tRNA (adenosine(37)-N6)-dimethylallyltransferase MiaA [Paracoccaceae bacterium]